MSKKIYNKDIEEQLTGEEKSLDEKQKWVQKMIKSAKHHHKICPYFDKKTQMCFLKLGSKCDRDGKFDICTVFRQFIENKYEEYKAKGKPLPVNFADLVITIF
uniref:Uncharacterized protein n=1 Tax=Staphylothermus marinus TaxID=2280 RepID=A0A7C4H8U0_STAMA